MVLINAAIKTILKKKKIPFYIVANILFVTMNSSCQVLSHSALLSGDNSSYWFPVVASQIFCMFTCRYLLLLAFSSSIFMLAHIFLFCNWTRKTFISALLTMQKPLTVWITKKLSKILKQMGIPDHLTCFLRNLYEGQGTADWKQIGKGEHQGCILSPYLFNLSAEYIMRNAGLEEAQAGIKIARRKISNFRYADDTTFIAESEEELKSFLMKVKVESEKVGLKLNIQKTKIMASGPITSWQIDG